MKWTEITVETYKRSNDDGYLLPIDARMGERVTVSARRPYGCVRVTVDPDRICVESQDGDGTVLERRELTINDLVCDGQADPDHKGVTDVLAELKKGLEQVPDELKEAGIGQQPNPLNHVKSERQEKGREEKAGDQTERHRSSQESQNPPRSEAPGEPPAETGRSGGE